MKKLTVYNVYLDDGKSVFRVTVPAASKKEAADYVQGNGDVVAINPASVQGIDLHHWPTTSNLASGARQMLTSSPARLQPAAWIAERSAQHDST